MTKNLPLSKGNKIKDAPVFHVVNTIILVIVSLVCLLPFLNVLANAFSTSGNQINFFPKGFTWYNLTAVFGKVGFWRSLGVSLMVTVLGTALSVLVMYSAAYALSKPDFPFRRGLMIFFIIVMIFSGGMVPNYIVVNALGLTRSPLALILPSVVQVYNLILIKSYLEGLPPELEESAKIDGANNLQIMFKVLLPVSLYILNYIQSEPDALNPTLENIQKANIESAMIVVSILPILIIYPFVLKFFTKGVTVGSVKG